MCGRFVVSRPAVDLVGDLDVDLVGPDLPAPSFNVAPTAQAAIVLDSARTDPPTRRLESARWGLVPPWAKDLSGGARAINARSEEVADKPTFRAALSARRAVVPVSGYYEWKREGDAKIPHYIAPRDGEPLLLAGLYEWWRPKASTDHDAWVLSFTILTRDSIGALGSVHDRMPLFVDAAMADAWLDASVSDPADLLAAAHDAAPALADELRSIVVGAAVGNVRNDSPDLIEPAA